MEEKSRKSELIYFFPWDFKYYATMTQNYTFGDRRHKINLDGIKKNDMVRNYVSKYKMWLMVERYKVHH